MLNEKQNGIMFSAACILCFAAPVLGATNLLEPIIYLIIMSGAIFLRIKTEPNW